MKFEFDIENAVQKAKGETANPALEITEDIDIGPCIGIAFDKKTSNALLLFTESDATAVSDVADVHRKPFTVRLTAAQRKDIRDSLDYLGQINDRKRKP